MLVYLPDQTLASLPEQFLDAVALADVRYQIQQSGVRLGRHGIRMDRVNLMGSVARSVGRDPGVTYQRAVRVSHRALSFFLRFLAGGILVIVALRVLRSPLLRCFSLIGRLLEFQQHRVGGCRDIRRCFQRGQHGRILCRSEPYIFVD